MSTNYSSQARGYAIAAVIVLALGFMIEPASALVYPDDEYASKMFKRLKEIGGGPTLNENGLTGVKWGASLASFPNMKLVGDLGATQATHANALYRNGDEHLTVNGVPISLVRYWFIDEQLGSVSLSYKGRESWGRLKQWVEQWYGPLERPGFHTAGWDAKLRQWVETPMPVTAEILTDPGWSGELSWTDAGTEVRLMFNPKTGEGELLMISTVLDELHAYEGVGPGDC